MIHHPSYRRDKLQKTVVTPTAEFAPISWLRGFVDEYGNRTESIVYLPGEIHNGKKPVSHIQASCIRRIRF